MAENFEYDVFISYASEDRPWANQLHKDLGARGIKAFIDHERLKPGQDWRGQLHAELKKSRHIAVLLSHHVKTPGKWVVPELGYFEGAASERKEKRDSGWVFIVNLDGSELDTHGHLHHFVDLWQSGLYARGQVDPLSRHWQSFVNRLKDEVDAQADAIFIPVTLLTMVKSEASALTFSEPGGHGAAEPLITVAANLGFSNSTEVVNRYDATRRGWKPLDGSHSVETILQKLQGEITRRLNRAVKWNYVDILSLPHKFAEEEVKKMYGPKSFFCLILIDPFSLYCDLVRFRLDWLKACFERPNSLVLVLPPYGRSKEQYLLKQVVKGLAKPWFDDFFEPPLKLDLPTYEVGAASFDDIRRITLSSLIRERRSRNAFLDMESQEP